jgi:hypothetical protein
MKKEVETDVRISRLFQDSWLQVITWSSIYRVLETNWSIYGERISRKDFKGLSCKFGAYENTGKRAASSQLLVLQDNCKPQNGNE